MGYNITIYENKTGKNMKGMYLRDTVYETLITIFMDKCDGVGWHGYPDVGRRVSCRKLKMFSEQLETLKEYIDQNKNYIKPWIEKPKYSCITPLPEMSEDEYERRVEEDLENQWQDKIDSYSDQFKTFGTFIQSVADTDHFFEVHSERQKHAKNPCSVIVRIRKNLRL